VAINITLTGGYSSDTSWGVGEKEDLREVCSSHPHGWTKDDKSNNIWELSQDLSNQLYCYWRRVLGPSLWS